MLKLVSEYTITVFNAYHLTFVERQHVQVLIKIANDRVLIKIGEHGNTSHSGHESSPKEETYLIASFSFVLLLFTSFTLLCFTIFTLLY
jgi:hypothetical protein